MLDRNSPTPLHIQARDILLERIESEEYKVNTMIPSEKDLCAEFNVSRMTIRAVLTELVREGKLYRIQGKGTFVAEPKITANTLSYVGIREQLERQGIATSTKVLSVTTVLAPLSLVKAVPEFQGQMVYCILRLRCAKGAPLSLHTSYIPVELCPGLEKYDLMGEQLCVLLHREYGLLRHSVTETLESAVANEVEAKYLEVEKGHPLLLLRNTIADKSGRPFEYSTVVFRGDKIRIQMYYEM